MLKKVILGGVLATSVGVHLVETKKTKELLKSYCPITNCKGCNKNKDKDKKEKFIIFK